MRLLRVRHDPASAAEVRHEVAAELRRLGVTADSVDDVVLVASELVGNAVRHTPDVGDDLEFEWQLDEDCVTMRVRDGSDTVPRLRHVDAATATSGRGLAIVAALASEWGVVPTGRGKQVWAQLPVHLSGG